MEQRRFDDLTRSLAANNSRRTVLKGLLAGAVGGLAGIVGGGEAFAAKGGGGSSKPDCCPSAAPRLCDQTCVNFSTDPNNCGGCGNVCPTGATCQTGACVCPQGTTVCGNACVDTTTDPTNCGTCGHACAASVACVNGVCGSAASCDDNNACTADTLNADGTCAHTPVASGTPCAADSCASSTTLQTNCVCDGSGNCTCVTQSCSPYQCKDNACASTCANDADCAAGFTCQGNACVAIQRCSPGSTQSCYDGPDGTAGVGICTAGTQTCGSEGTWGPCVGQVTPQQETCNNLDDDCDGSTDNGFDTQSDVNNCGTCGTVCSGSNATMMCSSGNCVIAACNEGFVDCDGNPTNGCECVGTACCDGGSCQTAHDNGVGQTYYDCTARDVYTATTATEACQAYVDAVGGGLTCAAFACAGGGAVVCDSSSTSSTSGHCWGYDGIGTGHVSSDSQCPTSIDPMWH